MSWWQLLDISKEARQIRQTQGDTPPVACPNDGEILYRDNNGKLRCKFDGWVWDGAGNPLVNSTGESTRSNVSVVR